MAISSSNPFPSGQAVRIASRNGVLSTPTSGLAPGFLQANLLILPSAYAADFRRLCARNPVPCPLLAESAHVGSFDTLRSHVSRDIPLISDPGNDAHDGDGAAEFVTSGNLDLRRDCPKYNLYSDSQLVAAGISDVGAAWTEDHVGFLIGCSFSFETALAKAGLTPRHVEQARNVPMYRATRLPLCPAGVFADSTCVVSMRPYRASEIEGVRAVTRKYSLTHGEPIAWGWEALARLGVEDIDRPQWGDAPLARDGRRFGEMEGSEDDVPVFWGCGVTTQEAVIRAGLKGVVMAHAPGHMLVLDGRDEDIVAEQELGHCVPESMGKMNIFFAV